MACSCAGTNESTDFKAASQLIAELQQNFQTESINFTVSEAKRKKVENELMLEASKNFQQRAQSLAQAWNKPGYQLVNLNINTNNSGYPPVPHGDGQICLCRSSSRTGNGSG